MRTREKENKEWERENKGQREERKGKAESISLRRKTSFSRKVSLHCSKEY